MKPLAIDLFCGLGGWTHGLLAEGYEVIGFDIERHEYGDDRYPAQLILQDVRTLHGKHFKDASLIVASSPCQKYSYMAMPWTKAKELACWYRDPAHPERIAELNELFDQPFRIQREACSAAGKFIPMVQENVRGAIPWVGRSRWNYGSFHLWGDIPALMPIAKAVKVPGFRFDGNGGIFQTAAVEQSGTKNTEGSWVAIGSRGKTETNNNPVHQISKAWREKKYQETDKRQYQVSDDGVKGFTPHGQPLGKNELGIKSGSKSKSSKAASAAIAKIPFPLARYIAAYWKPVDQSICA